MFRGKHCKYLEMFSYRALSINCCSDENLSDTKLLLEVSQGFKIFHPRLFKSMARQDLKKLLTNFRKSFVAGTALCYRNFLTYQKDNILKSLVELLK